MLKKDKPEYVNILVQKFRLFTKYELKAVPKSRLKKWSKVAKPIQGKLWNVKVGERKYMLIKDIDTKQKLADELRKMYGMGTFNLLFYSRSLRNSKFNRNFKCLGRQCEFYSGCRRKNIYKIGEGCKKNSKYKGNWQVRAKITIKPSHSQDLEYDYTFKYLKNKMHLMWFWNQR